MTIGKRFVSLSIPSGKEFLYLGGGAIIYFMVARLSLTFVLEPEGIAAIWPPSGIFLASILICRRHLRPWLALTLFATDLVAELFAGTPLNVSIIYALALTGDAVLGAWLLLRFVGAPITFTRVGEVFCFLILVVLGSNAVMSLVAAAGSMLLPETDFWNSFRWWMISAGIGNLLLTPFIIGWFPLLKRGLSDRTPKRITEAASLSFLLVVASHICFAYAPEQGQFSLLATYFLLPLLIWAALRFGLRGATLALLTLAVFAVRYAVSGQGVEVQFFGLRLDVLIVMQLYLAVMAVPTLFLTAVMGEYQREESAARESEARLRLAVSASNVGLWDWNLKSNSVYFSPEWKSQIGYRDDEISDSFEEWQSRVHPDDLEPTLRKVQGFLVHPHGKHKAEFRFRHRDGSYRWIYTEADLIRDTAGRAVRMLGCHIDITERKNAEVALRSSEQRFLRALENIPDVIVIYDRDLKIQYINEATRRITGRPASDFIGHREEEIWPPDIYQAYLPTLKESLETGTICSLESNLDLPVGGHRSLSITCVPVFDEEANVLEIIGVTHDLTEIRDAELALRESEEKFANAFHVSPAALAITRIADGKFLDVNEAFLRLFEFDRAEVIGHTSTELNILTPAERAPLIAAQLTTGGLKNAELLAHARSGKAVNLMFSSKPMELEGEPCHITVMIDITERKKAEEERQRFVMLADSSSEFIGMCDLDLQPLYVNPAGVRMVGLPDMAAACRVKVQDYFFPEDRPFIQDEFFPRVLREGHGVVEIRLRHFQTSEPIWMSYYLFHVRDKDGVVVGWATVSRDITERRHTEAALRKSEERLSLTLSRTGIGLWDWNMRDDVWYATPTYFEMLGYDPSIEAQNREVWGERTHPDDREFVINKMIAVRDGGLHQFDIEFRFRHADGTYRWINSIGQAAELDETGKAIRMLGLQIDITERKRTEMELRKIKDELELRVQERTVQLERERDRAEAADRVKSAFLATMSHELRTPLNSIIGFTGILLQRLAGPLNEEQAKQLAIVKRAGRHLLNLVNDVLDISKIEAGELRVDIEPVDLPKLLRLTAEKFRAEAVQQQLKFTLEMDPGIGMVDSNERRLEQVFNNFISNALKFTDKGEIRLICRRQGEKVRIEVRDTGIGIAADDIAKLFKPFSQLESHPKRIVGGTGLGLAISRRIVEALGGETGVASKPGTGSCFYFTLPIHRKPS